MSGAVVPSVRVVRDCTGVLGDEVGGTEVSVPFNEGYVVKPAQVLWLGTGQVLLVMHHSLTLQLNAKDVEIGRENT